MLFPAASEVDYCADTAFQPAPGSKTVIFAPIPAELRLKRPLDIPPAMPEMELTRHMQGLLKAPWGMRLLLLQAMGRPEVIRAILQTVRETLSA